MKARRLVQLAAVLAVAATPALAISSFSPAPARAEGLQRDSDDYNCHRGRPDDARTIDACARLWGTSIRLAEVTTTRESGRQRDSDDYNCHHRAPGAQRTMACARLRGELRTMPLGAVY